MSEVLPFPQRSTAQVHFTGYLLGRIGLLVKEANDPREAITITRTTQNHVDGTHRALVRIAGDENEYELTLRPMQS